MRLNKVTFAGSVFRSPYLSPVGLFEIVSSSAGIRAILCEKDMGSEWYERLADKIPAGEGIHIENARKQLDEYFQGCRKRFSLELDMVGTSFQKRAWAALAEIPFGKVISYSEQAERLGSPKLARAVGGANRSNPVCVVVPCHRVAGKNGMLTGFAGGLELKRRLLDLEGEPLGENDASDLGGATRKCV